MDRRRARCIESLLSSRDREEKQDRRMARDARTKYCRRCRNLADGKLRVNLCVLVGGGGITDEKRQNATFKKQFRPRPTFMLPRAWPPSQRVQMMVMATCLVSTPSSSSSPHTRQSRSSVRRKPSRQQLRPRCRPRSRSPMTSPMTSPMACA